ncbi:dihydrofolate reductase family protein [Microbacterium sp. BK668]|uniref:dihydrofolate reductase family protein n=1 Tax=Microbacterium sp. BK668 TaxID=2512118 RepID=UPI00105E972D|nr:dihydrofolate reductase family protein [Microbacterium sp. BK668]TDN87518.1 dihydrofolate reductase [Microbacterium sp. BK668]
MGTVIASATVSLDGFVAYPDNTPGELFDWYESGDVEVEHLGDFPSFRLTPQSAAYWREFTGSLGALVVGRTLFDITDGWRGQHPLGVPVVVVTHEPPIDWSYPGSENFHFVTTGIEDAIARAQQIAGHKAVAVAAGTIASQALAAGLLDEVAMDLVPVLLGAGVPYFIDLPTVTVMLGDPTVVVQGNRVTHLKFPVLRG